MVICASTIEIRVSSTTTMSIYCDCHGTEKLAEIRNGKLIIYDKRHGERHFVVLSLEGKSGK